MTEILLTGSKLSGNFGVPSLLISACKVLKKSIPDAQFKLIGSGETKIVKEYLEEYGIKKVETRYRNIYICFFQSILWRMLYSIGLNVQYILKNKFLDELKNSKIVIDIRGITLTDYFSSKNLIRDIRSYFGQSIILFIAFLLKKPAIKFTQDMGPFNNRANRFFARICLERLDFILARSRETERLVKEIGIKTPMYVKPDTAFVMDPASPDEVCKILDSFYIDNKTLVGINPSRQVDQRILAGDDYKLQNNYTRTLAQLADYLIENFSVHVILIPNEIGLIGKNSYDDIFVAKKVCTDIKNQNMVTLIEKEHVAFDLKGIIGELDLLIASRYHSIVASLSMTVPCLVIGWGFKYNELMGMMGQGEFVFDYKNVNICELLEKTKKIWLNRKEVRKELELKMPIIRESVFSGGELVKNLLG